VTSEQEDVTKTTRAALVSLIDETWSRITQLISPEVMDQCQEELKGSTSMLVLATVRRAADENLKSRATVEGMFRAADVNNDGQLTFVEWYDWLGSASSYATSTIESQPKPLLEEALLHDEHEPHQQQQQPKQQQLTQIDPMVSALSLVLGHAVCALKIASRVSRDDPAALTAAFVAGGIMAGLMDASVCQTMLMRLTPRTRDLIAMALTLESASLGSPFSFSVYASPSTSSSTGNNKNKSNLLTSTPPASLPAAALKPAFNFGIDSNNKNALATTLPPPINFDDVDDDEEPVSLLEARQRMVANMDSMAKRPKKKHIEISIEESMNAAIDVEQDLVDNNNDNNNNNNEEAEEEIIDVIASIPYFTKRSNGKNRGEGDVDNKKANAVPQFIQIVDLTSIPVAMAPPIDEPAPLPLPLEGHTHLGDSQEEDEDLDEEEDSFEEEFEVQRLVSPAIGEPFSFEEVEACGKVGDGDDGAADGDAGGDDEDTAKSFASGVSSSFSSSSTASSFSSPVTGSWPVSEAATNKIDMDVLNYLNTYSTSFGEESDENGHHGSRRIKETTEEQQQIDLLNIPEGAVAAAAAAEKEYTELSFGVPGAVRIVTAKTDNSDSSKSSSSKKKNTIRKTREESIGWVGGSMMNNDLDLTANINGDLEAALANVGAVAEDISSLRKAMRDLDDNQARLMRQLIMHKSGGRLDVMSLAMTLRATRLQHAARLSVPLKHQLGVETLQLWAPLSFQVGISSHLPELEVFSYVLLFPRSFGNFISWYTQFRPIARKLLANFRRSLEHKLQHDAIMPLIAAKVTLQSRLKSPSSAFKKMVRGAKRQENLHDMLGMRIIIAERAMGIMNKNSNGLKSSLYASLLKKNQGFDEARGKGEENQSHGDEETSFFEDDDTDEESNDDLDEEAEMMMNSSQEEMCVWRAYNILSDVPDWIEDHSRFKNYVTAPKATGYQSLHVTLVHKETSVRLEVQVRSQRMHMEAEHGTASHSNYKALLLPSTATATATTSTPTPTP